MERINVLDKGYVQRVGHLGSDEEFIEAARMSTDGAFRGWGTPETPGDEKLMKFLWDNKHCTPFEMGNMVIEVQAPILVFREWHRHRTQSFNELSGRYTKMPNLHYLPSVERIMRGKQSTTNKQGSEAGFSRGVARAIQMQMESDWEYYRASYEYYLRLGMSRELARINTPISQYSRMRANANIRNWLAFVTLRSAPDAQEEIRVYSDAVLDLLRLKFPRLVGLFEAVEV